MDKYQAGELIEYTISEDLVVGYTQVVEGYNITNTHVPSKTKVEVKKLWEDENNQDGVRPQSVVIKLFANGLDTEKRVTLSEANNWHSTFEDLDEFENGEKISYTIEEEKVENGYESVITGSHEQGYTVTNSRTPETTEVIVVKTWDDFRNQDAKRPNSITIRLLADGVRIQSKIITKEDDWVWKFENLPKYKEGALIVYTITEDLVEGYSTIVEGHSIINSYTPGKTSL